MTSRSRLLVLLISAPLLVFVLLGGFLGARADGSSGQQTSQQSLRVFEDVVSLILHNYVEAVDVDKVMEGAMRGLADGLDADSAYLSPDAVRALENGERVPAGDVGLDLTRQYYLRVVSAREGSAAARAGLRPGDYIRAIDGKPTRDLSVFEGTRLLRGEPGTTVALLVIRGNAAEPHVVELTREKPGRPEISGRALESEAGYIRIPAFNEGTAEAVRHRIADLTREGATRLVVDVRGASEGPLDAGLAAAGVFLPEGATVSMRTGREQEKTPIARPAGAEPVTLPVAVLVNSGTAGAAELFASALAGNDRATLVGSRTSGRAGLQKLVKLPQGHGLWMTWATYTTPKGEAIHEKGLEPGVAVEDPDVEFGSQPDPVRDPALDKALETLDAL
jgi:carboxyl-terminal processing protease